MTSPPEQQWSVRFVLSEDEGIQLSGVMDAGIDRTVHALSLGGSESPSTFDPPYVTFIVEAPDQPTARARAHALAERMQRAAGLPRTELPVAWVAPVPKDPSKRRDFLQEAKSLVADDYCAMAVVAAQVHLEVQVSTLLRVGMPNDAPDWLQRFPDMRGAGNLGRELTQEVIQMLWGLKVTELPEWPAFQAHAARRNAVVHEGQDILEDAAFESIRAVEQIWIRLSNAATRTGRAATRD